ncbi:sel1 repeat family protein [Pseudofrankia inefficax]|uniref:Sel1 domain protein repeat-containing protein n=1 Tax=Pseudofrankia inefficax (strain DSM 45817 / CECT 9037 / DDB 130130 / EuI1c) TaxID=298654 RepID=E3J952_PSEI1|nr:sel1 repeat family protein [Pseudofrankia inefficax]ADP80931.1 Sel1 domain protein repeat-containing protein [Pseudofrankia inefficax]
MRWFARLEGIVRPQARRGRQLSVAEVSAAYWRGSSLRHEGHVRRAVPHLRRAAEAGHVPAAFELSLVFALRGREQERLAWLGRAAESAREQGYSASRVATYLGLAKRSEQAEDVLRQAAENGDRDAAYDLGRLLEAGRRGAAARPAEAERYYLIACELGHVEAPLSLGSMLMDADRPQEGERYCRLAAERGNRAAARRLGNAAWTVGRDQDAERYLRMAAQEDDVGRDADDVLRLAEFLASKGRVQEALPLLRDIGDRAEPARLRAISTLLRRAGLDEEAQDYHDRADRWEELDALDGPFD